MVKTLVSLLTGAYLVAALGGCSPPPKEFDVEPKIGITDQDGWVYFEDNGGEHGQVGIHVFDEQTGEDIEGAQVLYFDDEQHFEVFVVEAAGYAARWMPFEHNSNHDIPLTHRSPFWQVFDREAEMDAAHDFGEYILTGTSSFARESCQDLNADPSFLETFAQETAGVMFAALERSTPVGVVTSATQSAREMHDYATESNTFQEVGEFEAIASYLLGAESNLATSALVMNMGLDMSCAEFEAMISEHEEEYEQENTADDDDDTPDLDTCVLCDDFSNLDTSLWPDGYGPEPTIENGWLTFNPASQTSNITSRRVDYSGAGFVLETEVQPSSYFQLEIEFPGEAANLILTHRNEQSQSDRFSLSCVYDGLERIYEGEPLNESQAQRIRLEHAPDGEFRLQLDGTNLPTTGNCSMPTGVGDELVVRILAFESSDPQKFDYVTLRE